MRTGIRGATARGAVAAATLWPAASASIASPAERCDFNGDGRSDLAVGAPGEDLAVGGSNQDDRAVNVIAGAKEGLPLPGEMIFAQGPFPGIGGDNGQPNDSLGEALACGDFDGNRRDDLAAGSQNDDITGGEGSESGDRFGTALSIAEFTGNGPGIGGDPEGGDFFGQALAP